VFEIKTYNNASISLCEYDSEYPVVARKLSEWICAHNKHLHVEHIGSTAVPGCSGKGYIDLLVMYAQGGLEVAKATLAKLGFQVQSGSDPFPEDRPMRVGSVEYNGNRYMIHAHVVEKSSEEAAEMIEFRNLLQGDDTLRLAYESEKRRIIESGISDRVEYAERKGKFIQTLLAIQP